MGRSADRKRYRDQMLGDTIRSRSKAFAIPGLKKFFLTGSKAGIQPSHAERLALQLGLLHLSVCPEDMDFPGWRLHPLEGKLHGHWSVNVNANWRLTFRFEGEDAVLVDYQDYH